VTDVSKYPAITIPSSLPLPTLPTSADQIIPHLRALHGVLSAMQASNARAFDVLNFFRIMMPPPGDGIADMPDASGSGALYLDRDTGRVFFDPATTGVPAWIEIAYAPDDIDDSGIDLSGIHAALLSGATTVADAMTILDDLDDADIPLSWTPSGWLFGAGGQDVAYALGLIDGFRTNGVIFANDVSLKWANNAGTSSLSALKLNTSDLLEAYMGLVLPNDEYLFGKAVGGTAAYLIGMNRSDKVTIGSGSYQTQIVSGSYLLLDGVLGVITENGLILRNDDALRGEIAAGGTFRNIGKVNTSDEVEIGDSALPLSLVGSSIEGIDDGDVALSGSHSGNLSGAATVADAMDVLDGMSTGGGADPWTYVKLASDFTSSLTANTAVTGLNFAPAINQTYVIEGCFLLRTATATVGARPGCSWPAGYSDGAAWIGAPNSYTAFASRFIPAGTTANAASTGLAATTNSHLGQLWATLVMGGSSLGNFQITLASETAGTNVTMRAGSWIRYRTI
jgi:hypothetical protein